MVVGVTDGDAVALEETVELVGKLITVEVGKVTDGVVNLGREVLVRCSAS